MSNEELQNYKEKILDDMEHYLDQPIRQHIVSERLFGPDQFAQRYHALGGNALAGGAHLFSQTAIFRPQNMSKKVD
jgi:phytoene dehydrogenase-like protein